ncbi:MAG: alpha/beta fold hydrolase, partial [Methyloceanibacter sp.]
MERKSVRTTDGVRLGYLEGGEGRPLILLPGWSQGATIFGRQFEDLRQIGRVIALDHRGHGESDKPDHGYKVERLAKDLFEVIDRLQLEEPDIVAHSMGAAVAWSYLLLFGAEKPARRLIFVDEPRALLARPDWPEQEREQAGAIIPSLQALAEFVAKIRASDSLESAAAILRPMFTAAIG